MTRRILGYTKTREQATITLASYCYGGRGMFNLRQGFPCEHSTPIHSTMTKNSFQQTHPATEGPRLMIQMQSVGWVLAMALLVSLSACDFGDNIPDVAGTYSGTSHVRWRDADGVEGTRQDAASVIVQQSGSQVTIGDPSSDGVGSTSSISVITGDLDETGSLQNIRFQFDDGIIVTGDTHEIPRCGLTRGFQNTTISFSGNQMIFQMTLFYAYCGSASMTSNLSRSS